MSIEDCFNKVCIEYCAKNKLDYDEFMFELDQQREVMFAQLSEYVTSIESNGIKQGSKEWHEIRINAIGGSSLATIQGMNPHSSLQKMLSEKVGLSEFRSDIAPQWGNMFEDVIKRVVEHEYNCTILGEDLYVIADKYAGVSYSPDGLAIMNYVETVDTEYERDGELCYHTKQVPKIACVLLEFKCPYSRIPSSCIPKYYVPQVKMGLDVLPLPSVAMFVEGVFRRCSIEQLGPNDLRDVTLVKSCSGNVRAYGIIGFYCTDRSIVDNEQFNDYCAEYNIAIPNNDLGMSSPGLFKQLMTLLDTKKIVAWYGDIYFCNENNNTASNEEKNTSIVNDFSEFSEFCTTNNYINIGLLPWKLFKLSVNYVNEEPNYLVNWMSKITELLNVVKKCYAEPDKKQNILTSYLNNLDGPTFSDEF